MRLRSRVLIGIAVVLIFGTVVLAAWIHSMYVAGRQIRNWVHIQGYVAFIGRYHKSHGAYPLTLQEAVPTDTPNRVTRLAARDTFGKLLYFESDGQRFLIASFGRDGIPDSGSYTTEAEQAARKPCQDLDVDTVYSSDGIRQFCGK